VLPLLGTLLFALIGIAALIIDGGLALTEQARLETAAEMMVSELAFVESLPDEELPAGCAVGDARRAECIQRFFLAPILAPLGVDFAPGVGGDPEWRRADRALDGAAIDTRGARLGAFDVDDIETGLSPETPGEVRLSRSSPLLFGWAALAPRTAAGSRPDFQSIQAARADEGLAPDLAGSGLRAEGFALQAEAKIDTAAGVPAMRVGPPVDFDGGSTGGLVGLAWRLDDLDLDGVGAADSELFAALDATNGASNRFDVVGNEIQSANGVTVGCLFDAPSSGAHLGQPIRVGATAVSLSRSVGAAYIPVIRTCGGASPILGFLELGVDAASSPGSVVLTPAAPARRNASGTPAGAADAVDAGDVWSDPGRIALGRSGVWQPYRLRVPRVESVPPVGAGGTSS